jgi:hypothetical protein
MEDEAKHWKARKQTENQQSADRVSERLCACAEEYFCLKVEPILHSDRQYLVHDVHGVDTGVDKASGAPNGNEPDGCSKCCEILNTIFHI